MVLLYSFSASFADVRRTARRLISAHVYLYTLSFIFSASKGKLLLMWFLWLYLKYVSLCTWIGSKKCSTDWFLQCQQSLTLLVAGEALEHSISFRHPASYELRACCPIVCRGVGSCGTECRRSAMDLRSQEDLQEYSRATNDLCLALESLSMPCPAPSYEDICSLILSSSLGRTAPLDV